MKEVRKRSLRVFSVSALISATVHAAIGVAVILFSSSTDSVVDVTSVELVTPEKKSEPVQPAQAIVEKTVEKIVQPAPRPPAATRAESKPVVSPQPVVDAPAQPEGQGDNPPEFGLQMEGSAQSDRAADGVVQQGQGGREKAVTRPSKGSGNGSGKGFKTTYASGEAAPLAVVTTNPQPACEVDVDYPDDVKELGIEGRVVLQLVINGSGKVSQAKILNGLHPTLDALALRAAKQQLCFKPARVGNTPVEVTIPYDFTFVLD